MQPLRAGETIYKDQVNDTVPKRIKELKFGVFSKQQILQQSVLEVCDRTFFDLERNRAPRQNGPLDRRMGVCARQVQCETCGEKDNVCNGHFGHVRLALPVFHAGYFKLVINILQQICKECSRILLPEDERRSALRDIRRYGSDNNRKSQVYKRILDQCKKPKICPHCEAVNGTVKKASAGALKIVHDKFRAFNVSSAKQKTPPMAKLHFDKSFEEAKSNNAEVEKHFKKAMDDMNPLRVLKLFRRIPNADCELLGMNPTEGRPEMFIWEYVPAPPVAIRPSVSQDSASTEDDITTKLADIINMSTFIRAGMKSGSPTNLIMEQWDFLQLQVALYINSDVPGLQQPGFNKSIRGFCQRLKGKQGRFRGNLSGKRVDFSGRTVISPDPNLAINEVAIPELVAKTLTYPEKVTPHNIEKLRQRVLNGPYKHPGAVNLISKEGFKVWLKYRKPETIRSLKVGATVERHLEDGDIVLFNRQPSLHKLSILCHYVKVRPYRTFRLNECVCTPYNADFDGDEMNLHVPQTEEARAEAVELMGVKHNLATPKNGEPIISAIQDFITGAYLLSNKDVFYDRKTFTQICMMMFHAETKIDLPPPAILKPAALWTGKQVYNVMMRPNKESPVLVNLDAQCREFRPVPGQHRDLDPNDGWLCIRNSEIMCGVMDKATVGSGKKDSVFYVILRDYGPDAAVEAMNRLARLCSRWLTEQGFSIGIGDVLPGHNLVQLKDRLVETAYSECDNLIGTFKSGKLQKSAGLTEEETLEQNVSNLLNKVRDQAGDFCLQELSRWNSPMIMATCGSKGSTINVSQMVAVVGQQIIGGKRVEDGFQGRSLPHFPKNARNPPSKGFVRSSFFDGLTPSEFIFHAMSGREGLVDTAVKTAETGYMSRRLMKSLEDLSTQYDDTVRSSSSSVVQFKYGDDMLDPADMEAKAKPVHFERTFTHCEATTWNNADRGLLPWEIIELCQNLLQLERDKLRRYSQRGELLDYNDSSLKAVDQFESARNFLASVEEFLTNIAQTHAQIRAKLGFNEGLTKSEAAKRVKLTRAQQAAANDALAHMAKLSEATVTAFVRSCLHKYKRAQVEPGHAVGAVGAQSIGEPGTQMTLKTFHFAGVAGMSITQGVPRIKEIINASKVISTPIITCELENKESVAAARFVKGRIEKTRLRDITEFFRRDQSASDGAIVIHLNRDTISNLRLNVSEYDVAQAILRQKRLKITEHEISVSREPIGKKPDGPSDTVLRISVEAGSQKLPGAAGPKARTMQIADYHQRAGYLMRALPEIVITGYPDATRAVITRDEKANAHRVMVEGYGLRACMNTEGVNGLATRTNSIMETREVLGIEAARASIIAEISAVMGNMDIDPRHMQLLADVMTTKGEVLGITRFGLAKMRDSVLQLASFEKTPDHLFEAAARMKSDAIEGVSECIIMGQSMHVGTGAFKVVKDLGVVQGEIGRKPTVFEDVWRELRGKKRAV